MSHGCGSLKVTASQVLLPGQRHRWHHRARSNSATDRFERHRWHHRHVARSGGAAPMSHSRGGEAGFPDRRVIDSSRLCRYNRAIGSSPALVTIRYQCVTEICSLRATIWTLPGVYIGDWGSLGGLRPSRHGRSGSHLGGDPAARPAPTLPVGPCGRVSATASVHRGH